MRTAEKAEKKLCVLFDATRLVARARFATPTGIDRVDLAYALALSSKANCDLRLIVFDRLGPYLLSTSAARQLIEQTSARWQQTSASSAAFKALCAFLEAPAGTERPRTANVREKSTASMWGTLRRFLRRPEAARALQKLLSESKARRSIYVNTSHGRLYHASTAKWLRNAGIASVFMIHDLIPIEFPEYNRAAEPARHAARLRTIAARASHVIVNSEATGAALQKYLQANALRIPQISALALGVDTALEKKDSAILRHPRPYFVAIGTIEPRKNHQLLLQIWRRLIVLKGDAAPLLILIGRRGWENQNVFNLLDRCAQLQSHVIECTGFSDPEIASLLRSARALLSPSFAEGYGLPVVEALALGTPVLASDIAAHREVGGMFAEYFDPLDGAAWLAAIQNYADENSTRRDTQIQRLSGYRAPRWEDHFVQAWQRIETAAGSPFAPAN